MWTTVAKGFGNALPACRRKWWLGWRFLKNWVDLDPVCFTSTCKSCCFCLQPCFFLFFIPQIFCKLISSLMFFPHGIARKAVEHHMAKRTAGRESTLWLFCPARAAGLPQGSGGAGCIRHPSHVCPYPAHGGQHRCAFGTSVRHWRFSPQEERDAVEEWCPSALHLGLVGSAQRHHR